MKVSRDRLTILAIVIAGIALLCSTYVWIFAQSNSTGTRTLAAGSLLDTINRANVIRGGYGVYPPYTIENLSTGKVSGVSIEIIEEIARELGITAEWRRLNWNTMGADLKRGEFDFVADPIFETPQRAREFTFTEPYSYFAIGIGVVRKGDGRFASFQDINRPGITVAVGQGFGEDFLVRARAPKANLNAIPVSQDSATPINAVLTGRADIAITNLEDARRFVSAHPDALETLWADSPPAYVPAGFALRLADKIGADFLSTSVRSLKGAGILATIASRYGATQNLVEPQLPR